MNSADGIDVWDMAARETDTGIVNGNIPNG